MAPLISMSNQPTRPECGLPPGGIKRSITATPVAPAKTGGMDFCLWGNSLGWRPRDRTRTCSDIYDADGPDGREPAAHPGQFEHGFNDGFGLWARNQASGS
jgi:hypothetical protein